MLYTTCTRCITTKHATVLKPAHNPDADGDNPIHIGKPGSHGEIERVSLKSRYTSDKGTTNKLPHKKPRLGWDGKGNIGRGRLQRASNLGRELRKVGAEWNDLLPD
ncbi:hypothetical protein MGG_16216 [Pyricularia oryzae 70-15]|uniref:Uncharacterized protein n=1 Tax=Pyricularia oryzae (strain 70-15 / ATCC MYA-4617 / FGSC 8958) TaxID=242507 RepID=G4MNE8_PYRO7|nr:uncharacterized protein MGG_16216 [Pyricularia oryzae 70-15]EHA57062.1 hypothetical protein MGG_16216 [Pyricularia oryzae 70-15]